MANTEERKHMERCESIIDTIFNDEFNKKYSDGTLTINELDDAINNITTEFIDAKCSMYTNDNINRMIIGAISNIKLTDTSCKNDRDNLTAKYSKGNFTTAELNNEIRKIKHRSYDNKNCMLELSKIVHFLKRIIPTDRTKTKSKKKLSKPQITGIIGGSVGFVILVIVLVVVLTKKKRKRVTKRSSKKK
jgi:hypothetical protein